MVGQPPAVNRDAWNIQARLALPGERPMRVPARFEWTQYPGHGPGAELLGDVRGRQVVELGCGPGDNAAFLASHGVHVEGVDIAAMQVERAQRRWSLHVASETFVCADALEYLAARTTQVDCCYSVFGAVGLCATDRLLTLLRRCMRPGGLLAFSVTHVDWPATEYIGLQNGTSVPVARYLASIGIWCELVAEAGFHVMSAADLPDPARPGHDCCTILTARAPLLDGESTLTEAIV